MDTYVHTDRLVMKPGRGTRWSRLRFVGRAFLLAGGAFILLLAYGVFKTGSLAASFAYLRGASIYTAPEITIARDGSAQLLSIYNTSSRPLRIAGYKVSCPCLSLSGLPAEILPWHRKEVSVMAESPSGDDVKLIIFVELPKQSLLPVVVHVTARGS